MDKSIYKEVIKDELNWAERTKEKGEFYSCIKLHLQSKIDGMMEIAAKDHNLTVKDYRELSDLAYETGMKIMYIESDPMPKD